MVHVVLTQHFYTLQTSTINMFFMSFDSNILVLYSFICLLALGLFGAQFSAIPNLRTQWVAFWNLTNITGPDLHQSCKFMCLQTLTQHPMPPGISSKPRLPMAHWMTVTGLRFFFEQVPKPKNHVGKILKNFKESPNAVVAFFWLIMVDIHALSRNMEVVSNSRVKQPAVKDQSRLGHSAPGNHIRIGWEEALFGDAYDAATPFERCKYGALNVTLLYFAEKTEVESEEAFDHS